MEEIRANADIGTGTGMSGLSIKSMGRGLWHASVGGLEDAMDFPLPSWMRGSWERAYESDGRRQGGSNNFGFPVQRAWRFVAVAV